MFVFCYTLALHLLIMGVLARYSHRHTNTLAATELLCAQQVCQLTFSSWHANSSLGQVGILSAMEASFFRSVSGTSTLALRVCIRCTNLSITSIPAMTALRTPCEAETCCSAHSAHLVQSKGLSFIAQLVHCMLQNQTTGTACHLVLIAHVHNHHSIVLARAQIL